MKIDNDHEWSLITIDNDHDQVWSIMTIDKDQEWVSYNNRQ